MIVVSIKFPIVIDFCQINMSGSIFPSVLKISDAMSFSYPMNSEHPRSVSFSNSHVGMIMAYASGNLIIVLVGAKYLKAILRGHQHEICTLSFERKGLHIVSCDVEGYTMFWHYQDSAWQNTKTIQLKYPLSDISWCAARQLICYSNKNGLFLGNVSNFEEVSTRLAPKSIFCQFFNDGSRLASHNYSKSLMVFSLQSKKFIPQVFKFTQNVSQFEFHPTDPIFMVITSDGTLRIYYQEYNKQYSCSTILSVPIPGRFVRPPALYNFHTHAERHSKIVFLTKEAQKIKIKIDSKGRIITSNAQSVFNHLQDQPGIVAMGLRSAFKTNQGTEAITVKYNGISVYSDKKNSFLFHRSPVVQSAFAPFSDNFFTRDEEKTLIFWPLNNPYSSARKAATNVECADWLDKDTIVILKENQLYSIDVVEFNQKQIDFPQISNCSAFFVQDAEIYAVCGSKLITKSNSFEIGLFNSFSHSKTYQNHFLFVTARPDDQVSAFLFPTATNLKVNQRSGKIDAICCFSLTSFVILSNPNVEMWHFIDGKFEMTYKFEFAKMNGLYCDSSELGARIFTFDDRRVYLIENRIVPFLDLKDITSVAANFAGHFVAISKSSMSLFPTWTSEISAAMKKIEYSEITNRTDVTLNVGYMDEDSHFLLTLAGRISHNFMPAPLSTIKPPVDVKKHVDLTFAHLLEYSSIGRYDIMNPQQIPAIPGQYASPSALNIETEVSDEVKRFYEITSSIHGDLDLFAMRFVTAVRSSSWPPPFIGLWLSYSTKQSTVAEIIGPSLNVNDLTKFFLAVTIEQQSILEELTRQALNKTWSDTKKVDPVALLYIALGNTKKIQRLYELLGDTQRSDFFGKDFSQDKWRKFALKNAYSSLSRQNFMMGAALFLVAGDIFSCCQICVDKLNDPILAFHIIRLIEKGIDGPEMKKFLETVKWNDQTIPIMIAKLQGSTKIDEMIKPLLMELNLSQNFSSMGDRRIALYQLYHRLTGDSSPAPRIALNMVNDGLALLAKYIMKLPTTRQVQTSVSFDSSEITQTNEKIQEEKVENKDDIQSISSDEDFDFGGNNDNWDDDDYSDSSDDSDDEKAEKDQKEKIDDEKNEEEMAKKEEEETNNDYGLLNEFFLHQIDEFSKFFIKKQSTDTNEAGLYALQFGHRHVAFPLLNGENKDLVKKHLSNFIDLCGSMYLKSALVPASPKKILSLCQELSQFICNEKVSFNILALLKMPKDLYSHSIFFGAAIAAAWSFQPFFLDQLLNDEAEFKEITKIPDGNSLFDVDVGSPHFPDTVPALVMAFLRDDFSHSINIESSRFLVMFLLFKRIFSTAQRFTPRTDFINLLNDRFNSLLKTLELYQLAQRAPAKLIPNFTLHNLENSPLSDVVKEEFMSSSNFFSEAHEKASNKLPFPAIYRNGRLMLDNPYTIASPFEIATSLCMNPHDSDVCAISDGQQIAVIHISQLDVSILRDINISDITDLIPHPIFNHFIAVSQSKISLFDFGGQTTDIFIDTAPGEKIFGAAFSPLGDRLAVISGNNLHCYVFDIAETLIQPFLSIQLHGKPLSVEWMSESLVAVSVKSEIVIYDTISRRNHHIEIPSEWGDILSMRFCTTRVALVVGTSNGYSAVLDRADIFSPCCVMSLGGSVVSVCGTMDCFCVLTDNSQISIFSTSDLGNVKSLQIMFNAKTFSALPNFIIAAGEAKSLSIWHAI